MLLLASIALAECTGEANRTTLELSATLGEAESAYGNADVDGFRAATAEMDDLLPCMQEQVPRSMVARLHRTYGIRAFVDREPQRAAAAFRGAHSLEPDYHFPPQLVPAQHPMARLYEDNTEIGPSEAVDRPAEGALVFDGRRRPERPQERLTLYQRIDSDENIAETALLWPGDPMPTYEVAAPSSVEVTPEPSPKQKRVKKPKKERVERTPKQAGSKKGGPMVPLLITAAGTAALAGGIYAAAGASRGAYENAPLVHKDTLKNRTNALVFTSAGLSVAAVGVGVTAVLTGKW